MKRLIFLCLFGLNSSAFAELAVPSSVAPAKTISQFIKDSIDSAEGGSAFNLANQKLASLYVPLRALDFPLANVMDVGVGSVLGAGHPDGLIAARINLPQIANGIFGTRWFIGNTHGPVLPALFVGPAVKAAWPPNSWRWDHDAFMLLSIPFSTVGL